MRKYRQVNFNVAVLMATIKNQCESEAEKEASMLLSIKHETEKKKKHM